MFKLLTEEGKQKVSGEYHLRRRALLLVEVASVLIIGIVGLLPSYVLTTAREEETAERIGIINGFTNKGDEAELQAWVNRVNEVLKTLSPNAGEESPSEFIKKVVEQKTNGIRLTDFSWDRGDGVPKLSVRGVAASRLALVSFKDRLNESGYFSEVNLPLSDLVTDKDIEFRINLSLKPK